MEETEGYLAIRATLFFVSYGLYCKQHSFFSHLDQKPQISPSSPDITAQSPILSLIICHHLIISQPLLHHLTSAKRLPASPSSPDITAPSPSLSFIT
ncbi:hypothetical protein E2C01_023754 [Portunus trituberculatus]|uniref:Uncharacterized protein n=1 Tax=Portunus trituberculatus TaxID=210409 RepID=A0A5B7EAT8_PORTR|nr:hypothetical protein [Portunus trituberculatus]